MTRGQLTAAGIEWTMRGVRRSSRLLAVACALLVMGSAAAGDAAGMLASARSHACCAASKYRCAGLKSPDDCCKRMRHTSAPPAVVAVAGAEAIRALPAVVPLALPFQIVDRSH